jgi:hypothetical protein
LPVTGSTAEALDAPDRLDPTDPFDIARPSLALPGSRWSPAPINLAACKIIITRIFEKNNDGIEDAPAFLHQADCLEMESNH